MTWIKLDVNFLRNPKIIRLSDDAKLLYVAALCYSADHLTDGFIVNEAMHSLGKSENIDELIEKGLLYFTIDGYQIHDYLEHQESRKKVLAQRESAKNRLAKYRESKRNANETRSSNEDVTLQDKIRIDKIRLDEIRIDNINTFDDFWVVYPRRHGKQAAMKSWKAAIKKVKPEVIIEAAKRYADDPNRVDRFTAHASTWLNQGRWEDGPLPDRYTGVKSVKEIQMDSFDKWIQEQKEQL